MTQASQPALLKPAAKNEPDYTLILVHLERRILSGEDEEKTRKILMSEETWKRLDHPLMVRWASLCRMAGCITTADAVYTEIHRLHPEWSEPFENHLEMLDILGRHTDVVKLLEQAKASTPPAVYGQWSRRFASHRRTENSRDLDKAAKPFEALRTQERLADRFLDLFSGRPDCFARQWADKQSGKSGYVPVRQPLRHADLEAHFKGHETCGIYLIRQDGTVKTAVIDADLNAKLREPAALKQNMAAIKRESAWMAARIMEISDTAGLKPVVEFSGGKGYHFWYLFDAPVPAGQARAALSRIVAQVKNDLSYFQLEVFPKQDQVSGQGFGNLVKLPLGVHRKTGKRSYFFQCPDRDVEHQLAWLSKVNPGALGAVPERKAAVELHPRFIALSEKWPDLARLSSCCPPLGRLIVAGFSRNILSRSEEQVLYQTLGFLPEGPRNLHAVFGNQADYSPHLVDLKISKLRGKPLGCKRIHSIFNHSGDFCVFSKPAAYPSPVLHLGVDPNDTGNRSEKVESLKAAMDHLRLAMEQVERYLK